MIGDRISQTVGGVTTTHILDTATPLTMVLSESTSGVTTRYWHGLDTLAQSDGTTTQYFAYDGLGSVRQLVDTSGSVGLAQTFDPYGNGYAKGGSAQSSFGYSGEQVDSNGFVYLRARYYNPSAGRFFQMDPSRQERNAYQYAASNPVMFVDPSGLACTEVGDPYYDWCKQKMSQINAQYSVTFIWPGGNSSTKRAQIEIFNPKTGQTCENYALGPYNPISGTPRLWHWDWTDIRAIYIALHYLSNTFPNGKRITEGGLFYLASVIIPGAKAYKQSGIYCNDLTCQRDSTVSFRGPGISGITYAIGFGSAWAKWDEDARIRTVLHELGHRTDNQFVPDNDVADMYSAYKSVGIPKVPSDSASEYYANAFSRYVFEKQNNPPLPKDAFKSFGSGSKDLDDIIDWKRGAKFRGKSLMWYMENRILPSLP